ncbi:MAG TPA: Rieske 2Fe-2S domain-containing protein [Vicinamibacteria bacterium]
MYDHGWYQVAFEHELENDVNPLGFAGRRWMGIKTPSGIRILDATCPHRGAHLAFGGKMVGEVVRCPFHGHAIGLGKASPEGFEVREYGAASIGGMVFAALSDAEVPDLPRALAELASDHAFITGFEMKAETTIATVMENGFDSAHFKSVHRLRNRPRFEIGTGRYGELVAEGVFEIPRGGWYERPGASGGPIQARYQARAFSPGVVIASLEGEQPFNYKIITTASPDGSAKSCTIRLTLVLPNTGGAGPPQRQFAEALLAVSRQGLEEDREIWNRLDLSVPQRLTENDEPAVAFAEFCRRFHN